MQSGPISFLSCVWTIAAMAGVPQPTTIRTDVNLVQLSVKVTDSAGRTVKGLGREAFTLFVDNVLTPITVFQSEDAPVTAGIVLDNSASMAPKRKEVIAAALAFAQASNPKDQMFVVHFNQKARFGLPEDKLFTGSVSELESAISEFQLGGTTALYDGIMLAQSRFTLAAYGRKLLLVITDGGDNSSHATVQEVLDAVLSSGAVIYAIGIFAETDRDQNPDVLKQLAKVTGGEAFFPKEVTEVTALCEQIAGEVRAQYTLGFSGSDDGKVHAIRVSVTDPSRGKLEAHTRPGYLAVKR
jgi:Ca-activated chloride channel homolog